MAKLKKRVNDMEAFRRMLATQDLKATPQRIAVHEVMMEKVHASADTVYDAITEKGGCKITRASVYNILSGLADAGIYARRMTSSSKMLFDVNAYRHRHLYDTRNHELMDIEADDLLAAADMGIRRRRFRGYKIDDIEVHILCHPTRKKLI